MHSFITNDAGVRLDKFVSEQCPGLSRTQAQKLINDGHITVNNHTAKAGFRLNAGDNVNVIIPSATPSQPSVEAIPLTIIYEDGDLLVIDKPAGMAVHPTPGHPEHTLVNAILSHLPHLVEILGSDRPGIVHRLDKNTSGLITVAKNNNAQLNLINQFKNHSVMKAYMALVRGHLTPEDGIIEAPIGRDPNNRKRMAVVDEGKEARTRYHVVKHYSGYTLLEVRTETGRTHQIRVHLSAINYPVAGDTTYGTKADFLTRQFLHACRLGLNLPSSGEYTEFTSELPTELAQALGKIA